MKKYIISLYCQFEFSIAWFLLSFLYFIITFLMLKTLIPSENNVIYYLKGDRPIRKHTLWFHLCKVQITVAYSIQKLMLRREHYREKQRCDYHRVRMVANFRRRGGLSLGRSTWRAFGLQAMFSWLG